MTEPMPTRDGDVVISQQPALSSYAVWVVLDDGQQEPAPTASTSTAVGRTAARQVAQGLARETKGAIYLRDAPSGRWIRLVDSTVSGRGA